MSYQVLARKWRPRDFSTLVGQEHVVRALTHALEANRLHHAYLFTGTRGVGKTTIVAHSRQGTQLPERRQGGITSTPAASAAACTEIDSGRFVDYVEMDAAANRGVDEMVGAARKARRMRRAAARYKVYMIDEVHQLSGHAFNAMLKTLEEPPDYVKFILATTDPQKIPVTVLSRCLQFNLKQMPPGEIVDRLRACWRRKASRPGCAALRIWPRRRRWRMRDGTVAARPGDRPRRGPYRGGGRARHARHGRR